MKILFLPNWEINFLKEDNELIQAPDKYVKGKPYWFFRYFPENTEVDIIDFRKRNIFHYFERRIIKTYIWQSILAFRRRKKYDIVISHGAQSGIFFSFLRLIFPKNCPKHYIFDIGAMNGARTNKTEVFILKKALKSNPYIICHSRIIIENYKNTFKNLLDRSKFIPFGVDVDYFKPSETTQSPSQYILSFGYANRDYKTLIQAWSELGYKEYKLKIIGVENKSELEPISNDIECIGKIEVKELIRQIENSLFVVIPLPVYNYSYGQMSFLQSMSLGKTVIVTKTPASIDYIKDGEGAFLVEPYNVNDMKEKIRFLLDNPEILGVSSAKSRPYILKYFTEELMGKDIFNFISG